MSENENIKLFDDQIHGNERPIDWIDQMRFFDSIEVCIDKIPLGSIKPLSTTERNRAKRKRRKARQ